MQIKKILQKNHKIISITKIIIQLLIINVCLASKIIFLIF